MLIEKKSQFYELSLRGLCGNTPRVWRSLEEFYSQREIPKYVTVRSLEFNSFMKPIIDSGELATVVSAATPGTYVINEIPDPGLSRLIQGELTWVNGQWYLFYSSSSEPMRRALMKDGRHAYGMVALNMVKAVATPSDFEDVMWIMDEYCERQVYPVIEFTVFPACIGSIPNRNTLIWEVRSTF